MIRSLLSIVAFLLMFSSAYCANPLNSNSFRKALQSKASAEFSKQALALKDGEKLPVIIRFNVSGKLSQGQKTEQMIDNTGRAISKQLSKTHSRVHHNLKYFPLMSAFATRKGLETLAQLNEVAQIYANKRRKMVLSNSVPHVNAPAAWAKGFSGAGQVVAVIDGGIEISHPMLSGKTVKGACFSTDYPQEGLYSNCPNGTETQYGIAAADVPNDYVSHGSWVSGVAAGRGSSAFPNGVAKDAKLIEVNASSFDSFTLADTLLDWDILAGMDFIYGFRKAFKIAAVNLSLGGNKTYASHCDSISPYTTVFNRFTAAGIAVVVAAGNNGNANGISDPACVSSAIAVGSVDDLDRVASFSNGGIPLDLLAPGVSITSAGDNNGPYSAHRLITGDGTSVSAPFVAGAYAILKAIKPGASIAQILSVLKTSGELVRDTRSGRAYRRIDLRAAMIALDPSLRYNPEIVPMLQLLLLD